MERNPGSAQSGEVTQQAKQQGQQLASQARQQAGELATRGGEQVKSQLANQKHEAAQRLTPIQTALRETAQQLRKQGQGPVAGYADKTSDGVERVSGYLRETDVDEMVEETRGFARSRPAFFLGGALALGFLGARFLKSSSQEAASGGNDQPVAALPPASGHDTAVGRTPTTGRTPMVDQPLHETNRPVPPQGV